MNEREYEKLIKPIINIYDELERELLLNIANRFDTYNSFGGIMYWYFDSAGRHFVGKSWGNKICVACEFVGNRHVFFEDVFEDWGKPDSFGLNMKLDELVYSSISIPCK